MATITNTIRNNIKWIITTSSKVNDKIHETALLILQQAKEHGDCSHAKDLYNAMPASHRRLMLKAWFNESSPIRLNLREGICTKVGMLKEGEKGHVPFDIEKAELTPFFKMAENEKEKEPLDFDKLVALVSGLAKRIEKKLENGEIAHEDQASAKAIAAKLTGLDLKRVKADNDTEEEAVKKSA